MLEKMDFWIANRAPLFVRLENVLTDKRTEKHIIHSLVCKNRE